MSITIPYYFGVLSSGSSVSGLLSCTNVTTSYLSAQIQVMFLLHILIPQSNSRDRYSTILTLPWVSKNLAITPCSLIIEGTKQLQHSFAI